MSAQLLRGFKGVFLNCSQRTSGYLALTQQDHRRFPVEYRYGLIRLIVLRINSTTRNIDKYIDDMMDCDKDTFLQLTLDAGEYYVAIEADWNTNHSRSLVASFYGEHGVQLTEDKDLPSSYDEFLNEIVLLHQEFT